ncbi:hypothetical protein ACKO6X_002850 [Enterococcus hirae]|nr:hypothetical protein [Enterococcus faecium]
MNKIDYLRMIAKCLEDILTAIHQILKKKRRKNMKYFQLVLTLITAMVIEVLEQKLA